jgi:hypothetical protein
VGQEDMKWKNWKRDTSLFGKRKRGQIIINITQKGKKTNSEGTTNRSHIRKNTQSNNWTYDNHRADRKPIGNQI